MIFLLLCRVRIYALFSTKRRYMENCRVHRCILGQKSSRVKSVNYLPDGRNLFTESRFSEQQSGCVETWEITRFGANSHGGEKPIGVICEQDIITAILSGFDGNKKKLTQWQDRFWEHMVKNYPDLERGESAGETGRDHIPPRLFKEAVHLNRMKEQIMAILNDTNPFNKKAKLDELAALLGKYVPGAEALRTKLKKYDAAYKALTAENAALNKQLGAASKESVRKKLEISQKLGELEELHRMVDALSPEILQAAKRAAVYKAQER